MAFDRAGLVGANSARRTTEKEYNLGTPMITPENTTYVYVRATAAIAASAVVVVTGGFTASTGAGNYTAEQAFAANEYGWVRKTASPL